MAKPSISMPDSMLNSIHNRLTGHTNRSEWVQTAIAMRLELTEAAETAGMADELDDDWWRDWLYDAAREHLRERRERELADDREAEEIEAD